MHLLRCLPRGVTLAFILLSAACSNIGGDGTRAPVEDRTGSSTTAMIPPTTTPAPQPKVHQPASPSASSAWAPLLARADEAASAGDYEQALALLERAQRIDPDSAEVYLKMAKTHRARGDEGQARATAERGLLYCASIAQCEALRAYAR